MQTPFRIQGTTFKHFLPRQIQSGNVHEIDEEAELPTAAPGNVHEIHEEEELPTPAPGNVHEIHEEAEL